MAPNGKLAGFAVYVAGKMPRTLKRVSPFRKTELQARADRAKKDPNGSSTMIYKMTYGKKPELIAARVPL